MIVLGMHGLNQRSWGFNLQAGVHRHRRHTVPDTLTLSGCSTA